MDRVKELKFSRLSDIERKNILYDINKYQGKFHIHLYKGNKNPLEMIKGILDGVKFAKYGEIIIITDENFFDGHSTKELKKKGYYITTKKSYKVPGIQVADMISGAFRNHDTSNSILLNIINKKLCEKSKKYLHPER